MKKLLPFAAALLLAAAACSKNDNNPEPGNNTGNNVSGKSCLQNDVKAYDSVGNLITETKHYYTDVFEDSSVTIYKANNARTLVKYTYTSKYERKRETYVNGTIQQTYYLEKVNNDGYVIESRIVLPGQPNYGYTITTYTCN